jgi:hypothetical protein
MGELNPDMSNPDIRDLDIRDPDIRTDEVNKGPKYDFVEIDKTDYSGNKKEKKDKNNKNEKVISDNFEKKEIENEKVFEEFDFGLGLKEVPPIEEVEEEEISIKKVFIELSNKKQVVTFESLCEWEVVVELLEDKVSKISIYCMYVYMCICIYMYICVCIYICICMYMYGYF